MSHVVKLILSNNYMVSHLQSDHMNILIFNTCTANVLNLPILPFWVEKILKLEG